jgi:anti-anti-sigma factor
MSERLRIDVDADGGADVVIVLGGDLDLVTSEQLHAELERHAGKSVVLDLAGVDFVDSTGLVLLMETARADGARIALRRGVSPSVARLLQVTKTEGLFAWVD